MKPEQAVRHIESKINQIQQAIARDIPRVVGKRAVDFYQDSFEQQGFLDKTRSRWQPAKRIGTVKGAGGQYKTLLSKRKELYNSIHFVPGPGKVNVRTNKPYAAIHNQGGTVRPRVTPKMRKFAWAQHYNEVGTDKKKWSKWKGLALTKKQRLNIRIVKRQFMGKSQELNTIIQRDVARHIERIFKG